MRNGTKVHLVNTEVHNEGELRIEHNFIWRLFYLMVQRSPV